MMDRSPPPHKQLQEQMNALYASRYGSKPHKLGGGTTFSVTR